MNTVFNIYLLYHSIYINCEPFDPFLNLHKTVIKQENEQIGRYWFAVK